MDAAATIKNSNADRVLRTGGPVDAHVHMVGNGSGGTGCWLRLKGWHRPLAAYMLRHIGLPANAISLNLEELFVERLLQLVRGSSLRAVVLLAHDRVYQRTGELMDKGSFYVPNEFVLSLARQHPEFLPAVSIHPGRRDAFDELDKCLEQGAVLMKCLPNCHNIDCNDPRYRRFWERMAAVGLPLLAHTGGEHTVPVVSAAYADPRILRQPLECGVTVIAAHCGTKSGLFDPDYFGIFEEMTKRYPNLYGDTSAFNVPIRGRRVPQCLRSPLVDRMIHGSDFPVPVSGTWAWIKGYISREAAQRWNRTPNILERDYQLKKAMGFPEESFHRVWRILRLPVPDPK